MWLGIHTCYADPGVSLCVAHRAKLISFPVNFLPSVIFQTEGGKLAGIETWAWVRQDRGIFTSQPVAKITTKPRTMNSNAATNTTDLWENDVSISNTFSRIHHNSYGRVKRSAVLLETHIRIAQSYCSFVVFIPICIQRLH